MIKKTFFLASAILMALMEMPASAAAEPISPDGTYMFAQRDTCDLYLDVYDPAPESVTTLDGKTKPTVLFMFGGGFIVFNSVMAAFEMYTLCFLYKRAVPKVPNSCAGHLSASADKFLM